MFIPIDNLDLSWAISVLPFIFGLGGKEQEPTPPPAFIPPAFTPTVASPSGVNVSPFTRSYETSDPVVRLGEQANAAAARGDYSGAIGLYNQAHQAIDSIGPTITRDEYGKEGKGARGEELGRLRGIIDANIRTVGQFSSEQAAKKATETTSAAQAVQAAQVSRPQAQDQSLQAVIEALRPTPLDLEIQALTIQNLKKAQAETPGITATPVTPQIDPAIRDDILGQLGPKIEREYQLATDKILGDVSQRGQLGGGIEKQLRLQLEERKQNDLRAAEQFANTKSAELGLQTGDLNLRKRLADTAATQFNIGIGKELQSVNQERALKTFSTLEVGRESALDRELQKLALRSQEALTARGQDVDIFTTLTNKAAEERKRRQETLLGILDPFGRAAGTFAGTMGALRLGK